VKALEISIRLTHFTLSFSFCCKTATLISFALCSLLLFPSRSTLSFLNRWIGGAGWSLWLETTGKSPVRSYLAGNAGSRLISEAKQPWACLVLGWGTTGEAHVLYSTTHFFFAFVFTEAGLNEERLLRENAKSFSPRRLRGLCPLNPGLSISLQKCPFKVCLLTLLFLTFFWEPETLQSHAAFQGKKLLLSEPSTITAFSPFLLTMSGVGSQSYVLSRLAPPRDPCVKMPSPFSPCVSKGCPLNPGLSFHLPEWFFRVSYSMNRKVLPLLDGPG
jgi:hypothetical protein